MYEVSAEASRRLRFIRVIPVFPRIYGVSSFHRSFHSKSFGIVGWAARKAFGL